MGLHNNTYLQRAWNKYGESSFDFILIESCAKGLCAEMEQRFMDVFGAANPMMGYNVSRFSHAPVGTKGYKHTVETRNKISASLLAYAAKRRLDPEIVEKWRAKQRLGRNVGMSRGLSRLDDGS